MRIDEHRSILEMSCKGLEIGALGRGHGILNDRHRLVIVLHLRRLFTVLIGRYNNDRNNALTCSWSDLSATFGARRRFLLEGSIAVGRHNLGEKRLIDIGRYVRECAERDNGVIVMIERLVVVVMMREEWWDCKAVP